MGNLSLGFWAVVVLLFGSLIDASNAYIHEYKSQDFKKIVNASYFHGGYEALYASGSKGKSLIRFVEVTFVRTKESAAKQNSTLVSAGLVEAIVFEMKERDRIEEPFLKADGLCCTQESVSCKLRGANDSEYLQKMSTFFKQNKQEVEMSPEAAVVINKTGIYSLYFVICDPELDGTVIRGKTVWMNQGGYLPVKMAQLMTFYGIMSLAYLLLGLVWFLQFARYWKAGIQLHYHITLVIVLGMCEMAARFLELSYLDSTGKSHMYFTFWAVTFYSVKNALSRLLLLVISTGYGVVNSTLGGGTTTKMLLLGVIYTAARETLGVVQNFGNINGKGMTFLMLFVAILETFFIQWIFSSLWKTLDKLKQVKSNTAKLQLYRKFANALVLSVLLSFVWIWVEVYFSDPQNELWRVRWIFPAFWYMLAFSLLVLICVLWPPLNDPTRYMYVAEAVSEIEEKGIALTETKTMVKKDLNHVTLVDAMILMLGNNNLWER